MGPENHFPGATAIGRSSSNSLALTMPMMDSLSEKVSIFPLSYTGGEILYSLVVRSIPVSYTHLTLPTSDLV